MTPWPRAHPLLITLRRSGLSASASSASSTISVGCHFAIERNSAGPLMSTLCSERRAGNPAGGPVGSRHRQQLNGEFIAALLRDFRHGGPKAIERVRRTQPAAYLKILALLVPREHKVEHSNPLKSLTDEELEAMVELLKASLEAKAQSAKVIEGKAEVVPRLPSPAAPKPAS